MPTRICFPSLPFLRSIMPRVLLLNRQAYSVLPSGDRASPVGRDLPLPLGPGTLMVRAHLTLPSLPTAPSNTLSLTLPRYSRFPSLLRTMPCSEPPPLVPSSWMTFQDLFSMTTRPRLSLTYTYLPLGETTRSTGRPLKVTFLPAGFKSCMVGARVF